MSARVVLVTGSSEPVSLQDAKAWLKVDEGEVLDDGVISTLSTAARQRIESETRRAMLVQTFDQVMDAFPRGDALEMSRAPLASVVSIKAFADTDATDTGGTVMASSGYYIDTASEPGRVVLQGSGVWPTATRRANAAIVRFTAGYSSSASGVPAALQTATKALLAYWYEHRGDEPLDVAVSHQRPLPPHVKQILEDFDLPEWG
jgi:uncharacterized phiE125 gp8 family phage protein